MSARTITREMIRFLAQDGFRPTLVLYNPGGPDDSVRVSSETAAIREVFAVEDCLLCFVGPSSNYEETEQWVRLIPENDDYVICDWVMNNPRFNELMETFTDTLDL